MKAYIKDNFVIAIGENDSLFSDCTPFEINEEQKEFLVGCKYPQIINGLFVEGYTDSIIINEKIQEVNDIYTKLYKSSLQRVTGKIGTLDYLNIQKEEYAEKYRIACLVLDDLNIDNQYMLSQLNEEVDFEDFAGNNLNDALISLGLTSLNDRLKDFCQIVKFKYEFANDVFSQFKAMITFFRTRMITDIELSDWIKFDQRIEIVKSITNDTTFEEIQSLYNQFKAL